MSAGSAPRSSGRVPPRRVSVRRTPLRRAAEALGVAADGAFRRELLAVAAEEVERSPDFAARVRARLATATPRAITVNTGRLVARVRIDDAELDPFGPPDPYYLLHLYGAGQLSTALAAYSYDSLREAAGRLVAHSPPRRRTPLPRGKAALIAALVARVTAAHAGEAPAAADD